MSKFSKLILSAAVIAMSLSSTAQAKLPEEVMTPYKAYRTALTDKDTKKAKEHALKAWKAAEKHLGDHKTTGDLALNYAAIAPGNEKNPYKNYEERAKAYKRAIKLSHLHGEDGPQREVERRVALADLELTVTRRRNFKGKDSDRVGSLAALKSLEGAITKYDLTGSTFEGDMNALYAGYYSANDQPDKAIEYAKNAISIFEKRDDNLFSKYEYWVRFFKGDSHLALSQQRKDDNHKILGTLEYQHVMQNLEGSLDAEHPFIKRAFQKWMKSRSELEDKGLLREAEQAGLCECWPYENYKDKAVPLERIPGKVPSAALRAGRSGHVIVKFDVDDAGKPANLEVVSSSHDMFHESALKAVSKFKYSQYEDGTDRNNRKGITTKMTYRVTDSRGNILPE